MHTPAHFTPAHVAPASFDEATLAFAFRGVQLLVRQQDDKPIVPTLAELRAIGVDGDRHYLGALSGVGCVAIALADGPEDEPAPPGFRYSGLRGLFTGLSEPLLALAARAFQVVEWHRTHRYCGRCGTPTRDKAGERAKECPACGHVAYPRVSPAMMALITRGDELLLARSARFTTGMYSALAGFVEPGETIEDCVAREVREEVGVEVANLRYFGSQSWAFPHSLMIAFTAEHAGGDIRLDDEEIADAQWFDVDALPQTPSSVSIARRLIDETVASMRAARRARRTP